MADKKPYLIVLEGHNHTNKERLKNFIIKKFKRFGIKVTDLDKFKQGGLPINMKKRKSHRKKIRNNYNKITNYLLKNNESCIITDWVRSERIHSLMEKRDNLEHLLYEDEIYEKYNVVTFTLLFQDYEVYINKTFYNLGIKEPEYSIGDFEDIMCFYMDEYLGVPQIIDEDEDEEVYKKLDLFNQNLEILIDIFDSEEDNTLSFIEAWNYVYPFIFNDTPHEAPPINLFDFSGNQRKIKNN